MGHYIQVLIFVIIGIILLWFGHTLFLYFKRTRAHPRKKQTAAADASAIADENANYTGASQTCPVCSAKLTGGEQVKTTAFPPLAGSKDRLMHIKGCVYCLSGERKRACPVCGAALDYDDYLAARIFERNFRRSHVHIQGCTRCCKMK